MKPLRSTIAAFLTLALLGCSSQRRPLPIPKPPPPPPMSAERLAAAAAAADLTSASAAAAKKRKTPAAPVGLTVADAGNGSASLSWSDIATNETGYVVQRQPPLTAPPALGPNVTSFTDACGAGTFLYHVAAFNDFGTSTFTPWVRVDVAPVGGGNGELGWTVFTASTDTHQIYVSSSTGNDASDGLSAATARRTLAGGYALMRDGFPDWLLLKGGDTWHESFPQWNKSGRSTTEVMRIGSYGTGSRPLLLTGNAGGFFAGSWGPQMGHLAITDIAFIADGYDGLTTTPRGIEIYANWTDVLIENYYLERYFVNIAFNADPVQNTMSNIRLRRDISVDAFRVGPEGHAQGSYFGGVHGLLLEDCAFDHNGWSETIAGADPTIFRHNVYIQWDCTDVTTRNLISGRAGATGMQQRPGGLCEGHLFLKNPLNIIFGTGGVLRDCVVLDSRDIDAANPRGIGIQVTGGANSEVYRNLCATRTVPGTWNLAAYSADNVWSNVWFHDNVAWKWRSPGSTASAVSIFGQPTGWLKITNNHFQMGGGGDVIENATTAPTTYANNHYFSTDTVSFQRTDTRMGFPQWAIATGDTGSAFGAEAFPDPDRTIATYMATLGQTATLEAFLAQVRQQSRGHWRTEYTAAAANAYLRAGFGGALSGN